MTHLGSDVAAFVDGQLPPASMLAADAHVQQCDACDRSVRQQRLIKSRMSTVAAPEPPSGLLATLAGLAADPPQQSWWSRIKRAAPFRAGMALVGASVAVAAAAYVVGGGAGGIGDRMTPPVDEYSAAFFGATSTGTATHVSDEAVDELSAAGWPCHPRLAGDLKRTRAGFAQGGETIVLNYSNGTTRMHLYEQAGRLEPAELDGFVAQRWGGSAVWVREGAPTVLTWDNGGVVYTLVTDADSDRIRQAVSELPTGSHDVHPVHRMGDGLNRLTGWVSAA